MSRNSHNSFRQRRIARSRRIIFEPLESRTVLAATITVNSVADPDVRDAVLTLREAIEISNQTLAVSSLTAQEKAQVSGTPTSNDTDTIAFNISGQSVQTINLATALPTITQSVTIDGYTQPGAAPNTNAIDDPDPSKRGFNGALRIELNGAGTVGANGLEIAAGNCTVRGLVINRFAAPDGTGLGGRGILLEIGEGNHIEGNFLGTDPTGTLAEPNFYGGIQVYAPNNTIGGVTPAARNVISGNDPFDGISVYRADGTVIQGNLVGTQADGVSPLPNGRDGIALIGGADHVTVGGTISGAANQIAFNLSGAIAVIDDSTGNSFLGNSIFSNGFGIDLAQGSDGPTANDPGDIDTGANDLQNFPVLTAIDATAASTSVNGALNSTPGDTFRIEFFANAFADTQCYGQGQTFLGSLTVKDNDSSDTDSSPGNIGFSFTALGDLRGQLITMTATDLTTGSTSEFSLAYPVTGFVVSDPQGQNGLPGGIIQAIICANTVPNIDRDGDNIADPDAITFNIPGSGVHTIAPQNALPTITDPVTIDGYSQPGASPNSNSSTSSSNAVLLVELSGIHTPSGYSGLTINTNDTTVQGLVINHFTGPGISITSGGLRNHILGNFIGTDATGTTAAANASGVLIGSGSNNTIGGLEVSESNLIAFNTGSGVSVAAPAGSISSGNSILSNSIFSNGGLGIDIGNDGRTLNDADDADSGPNNFQNFPVLLAATIQKNGQLAVTYNVPSDPGNSQYPLRLQFFKADSKGQGQTFLGDDLYEATEVGTSPQIVFTPLALLGPGDTIVATATDSFGNANSSEFSAPLAVNGCSTLVVNTSDSGVGSLRDAINCANNSAGPDTINFAIPGANVHTISPTSALPTITDSVLIDGYSQPGAAPNTNAIDDPDPAKRGLNGTLLIQLSGPAGGTPAITGLTITGSGSTLRGLVINGFANSGVRINGGDNNVVEGNYIGVDPSGLSPAGNKKWGVVIDTSGSGNRIGTDGNAVGDAAERNLISGNGFGGVGIIGAGTDNNVVAGNFLGLNSTGTAAIGNANRGADIFNGAQHNRIGVDAADAAHGAERNVISGNGWQGVGVYNAGTTLNDVAGNWIGLDVTGAVGLPNLLGGVSLFDGATQNTIGGLAPGSGNVIAFNTTFGVRVVDPATSNNAIVSNSIYSNSALGIDLGSTGPTANDSLDADSGPNKLQNYPDITYATRDDGKLKVTYKVPSASANSTYPIRVEFFLADSTGQGKTYLGFDTFTDSDSTAGGKTVAFTTNAPINVFDKIVATATDSLTAAVGGGPANTSEFSPAVTIVSPWQNPGQLRWDVTDDTFVSADDVLAVVNHISAHGSGLLPSDAQNEKPYFDVDGDDNVVAADCLDIINYINAGRRSGGEAEATQQWAGEAPAEPMVSHSSIVSGQSSLSVDVMAFLAADVAAQATSKRRR